MKFSFYYSVLLSIFILLPCSTTLANERDNIGGKGFQRAITKFKKEPKVAVVVGINTYHSNSGLQPLKYAARDASLLGGVLKSQGYAVSLLMNQNAIKSHILRAIQTAGNTVRRNQGTLIFAYSGHGFSSRNRNFLAPFGTLSNNFSKTALSLDEVIVAIKKTGVRRAVLFIDACRDKPMMKGGKSIATPSFIYQRSEGIKILYSTKFGGVSYESDRLKQGVFSHFLTKALKGESVDPNGKVTFDTTKRYVENNVAKWVHQHQMPEQRPFVSGNSYGVFILGDKGRRQNISASHQAPTKKPIRRNQQRHITASSSRVRPRTNRPKIYGHYRDNGNGTITDTKNKLMWKKCSEGQKGDGCSGKAETYTWDNAMKTFENTNFAGSNEWRLPTKNELKTLVFCSNKVRQNIAIRNTCEDRKNPQNRYQKPTINHQLFPRTEGSPVFSSIPYAHRSADSWGISFINGNEVKVRRGSKMNIRLVRKSR